MKLKLYKHQQKLVDLNPAKYLLPWETGTGKTFGLVGLIKKNNVINEPVLIITIKSDKYKWVNIIKEFGINADVMSKEEFKKEIIYNYTKKVYDTVSKEILEVKKTTPRPAQFKKYEYVIVDEAHFFAGLKSMMYKSLLAYLKFYNSKFVWLATATPYPGNPWNLFCFFQLLGFNRDYKRFRNHFFEYSFKAGGNYVKKEIVNNRPIEKEIAAYINFLGKAIKIEECVDMPPKILIKEYFELTPEQKKAFKEIREDLILTRNLRWHQICGGTLHKVEKDLETGEIIKEENLFFKSQKLNRIIELCEEHKKIFIVCKYQNEVDYIENTIKNKIKGRTILKFTGKNSQNRSQEAKSTDLMSECIVIANAACSAAYECKTINLMVFYSYDFSLVNYTQIIGRIRRLNSLAQKTYLSLIIKDSIDEDVYECIQDKKSFDVEIYHREI